MLTIEDVEVAAVTVAIAAVLHVEVVEAEANHVTRVIAPYDPATGLTATAEVSHGHNINTNLRYIEVSIK